MTGRRLFFASQDILVFAEPEGSIPCRQKVKVEVKFTLEEATKVQRRRGIALLLNLGAR